MNWILRMAYRDSRRNRSRLLLFMGSISAGIAALVAIYSFGYDLRRNVDEQAASLIGADLTLSSNRVPGPRAAAFIDSLATPGTARSDEENFGSMALFPRTGSTRLVQVRALAGAYPYYGSLETTPVGAATAFQPAHAALVEKSLALQFNVRPGDSVQIGNHTFPVAGTLESYPGGNGLTATMAPVVYIPLSDMASTGLNQVGSRARYSYYFHFKPGTDVDKLASDLEPEFERDSLRYETVAMRKESTGRVFTDLTRFMSLVGFLALLLGCIGVASAIQIYIREKTATIAVMRCLGVTVRKAFLIYLLQVAGIGLIGALIGAVVGVGVQQLLPRVMKDVLPITITTAVSWAAIGQGIALGLIMALVFGLLPLLSIRRITPLYTLRSSYEHGPRTKDPWRWPVYVLVLAFIAGFTWLQLRQKAPTFFFTFGLLLAYFLLSLVGRFLMAILRRITRTSWSFPVRQGFANLYRPNNQTLILVVSIGLSTALVCTLLFIQQIIVHQLVLSSSKSQANMIVFDIQARQEKGVDSLLHARGLPIIEKVPIVTLRYTSIKGKTSADSGRLWHAFNEELRVTYRDHLTNTETITDGKWTGQAGSPGTPVPVSLEERYAQNLGLKPGDSLVFNVQGIPVEATVGSLRKVEWNRMQTNFRIVFPTGVLEQAPQFRVLLTRTPSTEAAAGARQAIVRAFPTVSVIDLGLILSVLDSLLDKINYVIRFMAAFSMVTGLIVLIASVRNSKYQRIQESVLLRTLGAGRRTVFSINALEYIFLGFLSGLTGILIALVASWCQARFLFKLPFAISYGPPLVLLVLVSLLTMTVGLLNSRGILNRSTLEVLRNEV
ncbi:ABC transporter permease [Dinghuibacter silviterrae]|uniref:Putative ABC transport system permease protein n=1 Tax=Dinghuibacter silviterrae TaxID=1539049 RepID=A0A4R8DHL2_9BACT|nr:FtsX-like permease family protein [Dinghuibacter silviterrae]TDW97211.1 putative ABC transport system permease protein [Dinghuibacter silviterrae]